MKLHAYLVSKGFTLIPDGDRFVTNSPIKALSGDIDKTPSFVLFGDGFFKDFSTGHYGDLSTLMRLLGDSGEVNLPDFSPPPPRKRQSHWNNQIPPKYLDISPEERDAIVAYANSRRITEGFIPGVYFRPDYSRRPAMMMVHQDIEGRICGAKFRAIDPPSGERRFVMRGRPGFYILKTFGTLTTDPVLYLVESETSANSLWMVCRETNRNAIVISHGSVEQIPKELPYSELRKFLILDVDGNDELYSTRVAKYSHLGLEPLKLNLPKGDDINSLYNSNSHYLIENLI